jgi:hypothetical protein
MEFPFPPLPPEPPGYTGAVIARWILVAWSLIGLTVLIARLRQWKSIRSREIVGWIVAAGLCGIVIPFGRSDDVIWDDNKWLETDATAALSVCIAGMTLVLTKLYTDGRKRFAITGIVIVAFISSATSAVHFLFPFVSTPREVGRRMQCRNNLKEIALAMHNYHDVHLSFPPFETGNVPVSWRVTLLPFLGGQRSIAGYQNDQPWNAPPNDAFAMDLIHQYSCPSDYYARDGQGRWFTAYSMPTGLHTVGDNPLGTTFRQMTDGAGSTILLVEACGAQIVWTEPRDVDVDKRPAGVNLKGTKPGDSAGWLSSYHPAGTFVALADGSVRLVSASTDPKLLKKLVTINGGEKIGPSEW